MFSYRVKVRKINSPKLKGVASLVIDDILEVDGFKIIEGSKGLFVSVPSHKGTVMEDGVKVEKYFDDVRFTGEQGLDFSKEIKDSILSEYNSASDPLGSPVVSQTNAVKKKQTADSQIKNSSESSPPRDRKPLWGF